MVSAAVITGFTVPILTSWLSDQLPRPGLEARENERRLRNIVLSIMVGFGAAYLAMEFAKRQEEQAQTAYKPITPPGYYEG